VDQTGVVATESIDLRAFYTRWAHGFAVCEMTARGQRNSLQFYDASGAAIHKIYLCEQSYIQAYESIVKNFAHPLQQPGLYIETPVSRHPEQPDAQVDVEGLHRSWNLLKDTHEFYGLLKDYQVSRVQALRLAQPKYVQQIHRADILRVLTAVAAQEISIMVFVGNPGMLQIHSGPINQVSFSRPWLNVTDASFNLHLRMDHVDSAWLVKKPTVDGLVTSLELFDAQGEVIAMLFGSRKPGQKELESWRELLNTIQETQKYFSA
jgi:putative hemin transport protein